MSAIELLANQPCDSVGLQDVRGPLRVLIASLATGGAERIVQEWLCSEASRGRNVELAVLYEAPVELTIAPQITLIRRRSIALEPFLEVLAKRWADHPRPISTHLVRDSLLEILWRHGLQTVPVLHNDRRGWVNEPATWPAERVPLIITCADAVLNEVKAKSSLPVVTVRHLPKVSRLAWDDAARATIRHKLNIPADALLIGAVGALKPQKNYVRAIEILAQVNRHRCAYLCIVGGILNQQGSLVLREILASAKALGVGDKIRLPGFQTQVDSFYAAFDVFLNCSHFEGFSIATQEALAAGVSVIALDINGQGESSHRLLTLVDPKWTNEKLADLLVPRPVRNELNPAAHLRAPRLWSLTTAQQPVTTDSTRVLFITANLNAGGAQRSLVNLVRELKGCERYSVAVCNPTTHSYFPMQLADAGIHCFRPCLSRDVFDIAESLLAWISQQGVEVVCLWNMDPKVKLLLAKFLPGSLKLVDVSPGGYAFAELAETHAFQQAIAFSERSYYERLDQLVLKYHADLSCLSVQPSCTVIPNGVASITVSRIVPSVPRILIAGRIAPSKQLEVIIDALAMVRMKYPDLELHIFGQAEPRHQDYLELLHVRRQVMGDWINFRGASPDLQYLEESWTLTIVLGTYQGCPNAVLEAMSAGIPVIANASGGTGELVIDGETGFLLPETVDAPMLAATVLEALVGGGLRESRAEAGQKLVHARYDLKTMIAAYREVLS